MEPEPFNALFTRDKPVIFSFHGYPSAIHQLISARQNPLRFHVRGYIEEGITTTPFDMLVRNGTSRFQLAIEAIRRSGRTETREGARAVDRYLLEIEEHEAYIRENGKDPDDIAGWRWTRG
jgi:xylulose-5-phosphate/fructose-6-phosphate phosphoketolase